MKTNPVVLAVALALGSLAMGCATTSSEGFAGGGGGGGIVASGADATSERAATAPRDRFAGLPIGSTAKDESRIEPRPVPLHEAMICARCSR